MSFSLLLFKQSSIPFLPLKEGKLHIFACAAVLQQELTKLHKRIACGEAQRFQHFLFPSTASTTANFWVVSATILPLAFLLCSPVCHPRATTVSCEVRQVTGLEEQRLLLEAAMEGKNNLIFKLILGSDVPFIE